MIGTIILFDSFKWWKNYSMFSHIYIIKNLNTFFGILLPQKSFSSPDTNFLLKAIRSMEILGHRVTTAVVILLQFIFNAADADISVVLHNLTRLITYRLSFILLLTIGIIEDDGNWDYWLEESGTCGILLRGFEDVLKVTWNIIRKIKTNLLFSLKKLNFCMNLNKLMKYSLDSALW